MVEVDFPVNPVVPSPRQYGYRAKITPHFNRPKDSRVGAIGFLRAGMRSELIDVPRCEIATDAINARLATVRDEVRRDAAAFKHGATLLLREVESGQVITDPNSLATSRAGNLILEHLAGDFFQNNPSIVEAFVHYTVAESAAAGARFLVDAYCGSGLFALSAAPRFEEVAGVEISPAAVRLAQRNAARNRLNNTTFLEAEAGAIFRNVSFPGTETAVILDPPRGGCSEAFLQELVTWHPSTCVYVSCNPATQMRDLRMLLAADYVLSAVQPFDLFPQTKHLECVISLRAKGSPT
jgi:23S rRNA (uracil1939-C5)-methyltransferase/tRNA (uracil-5-)-methyltransferase